MHANQCSVFLIVLLACLVFTACYSDRPVELVAERFENSYRAQFHELAPFPAAFQLLRDRLDSIGTYRQLLVAVDSHALSETGKAQRLQLQAVLEEEWTQWAPFQQNPAMYNLAGLLKQELVAGTQKETTARISTLIGIMDQAEAYYAAARQNLRVTDASLYRLAAQKQYLGLEFLRGELQDSLSKLDLPEAEKVVLAEKIGGTHRALKDYLAFCESAYLNHMDSSRYQKKEPHPKAVLAGQ